MLHWNGKVDSFLGWRMPKLSNNCLDKSCWELNFAQKSQWTHMYISIRGGGRGLERSICFKYLLYWNKKSVSLLELSIISKNCSNENCSELNFVKKKGRRVYMSTSRRSGARGFEIMHWEMRTRFSGARRLQRLICLKYHNVLKWESPLQYNVMFETYQSIASSSSTPGEDWHAHPLTFLYEYLILNDFSNFLKIVKNTRLLWRVLIRLLVITTFKV